MEYFLTRDGLLGIDFYYRESCKNVYKKFETYINGIKKDIRLARKLLIGFSENEPDILTAKTYFWKTPYGKASDRRRRERRRYEEWENFISILKEKNKSIELPYLLHENEKYLVELREDEIAVIRKRLKNEIYHFTIEKSYFKDDYNFEELIKTAKDNRIKQIQRTRYDLKIKVNLIEIAKKVYIDENDSIKAGNCKTQTLDFAKKVRSMFSRPIKAIRGDFLLKLRNDDFTRRIIYYKAKKMNLI